MSSILHMSDFHFGKELEAEKVRNANNLAIMDSCYKTIKRAVDKKGFITNL